MRGASLLGEIDYITSHLYELIQKNVDTWRGAGYPCADYPAIAEILEYATLPETGSLRAAQIRALVMRILRRYGYPPDKQEKVTQTVLEQAEVLCRDWAVA